ncbi:hypothetical protein Tco_0439726 [Tanacetum coccineum]
MNEESKDLKKKRVVNKTPREENIAKVPAEQEVTEQGTKKRKSGHVKMIARKRPRPQPDDDSDDEPDGDYLVVYRFNRHFRAFNYLMEVLHIFDRQDLFHLYDLVMKQYSEIIPEEELAIPEQTTTGKGISNSLMAGSLPKTIKPT